MEVWMKIGIFKQALCDEVVFPLPDRFMVMDVVSKEHFPYLVLENQNLLMNSTGG